MPLHASSQSFSGLWVSWLNLTSSFRRSITNKMNEVLKNTHTFVEVLKMAKCEAVERWDEAALHRAYKWAQYFEEVSWCRFFGTPLFSASPGLQSHIYIPGLLKTKASFFVFLLSIHSYLVYCTLFFVRVIQESAKSLISELPRTPHHMTELSHKAPETQEITTTQVVDRVHYSI